MNKLRFRVWNGELFLYSEDFVWVVGAEGDNNLRLQDFFAYVASELCVEKVVQQSTGLKDRNGEEVYEGDILKFNPCGSRNRDLEDYLCRSLKQVKWGLDVNGQYPIVGFVAINLDLSDLDDGHQLNWMDASNIEVVGNIFENPKLLEL